MTLATLLTILLLILEALFPSAGKASWYDDGPGRYAAVHSYTWGDPRYLVEVCRQDDPAVCVIVTVRDHMESVDKAIDLGPDAFVALWPGVDPATALNTHGVVDVTITKIGKIVLPATDTK